MPYQKYRFIYCMKAYSDDLGTDLKCTLFAQLLSTQDLEISNHFIKCMFRRRRKEIMVTIIRLEKI